MAAAAGSRQARVKVPYHVMIKGIGPLCNLDCTYCYYLEKTSLFPKDEVYRMEEGLLETFVKRYIRSHPGPNVIFPWHGGEPTLLGLDFFRKAVEYQKKYLPEGWNCINVPQTNGTRLTDEWCTFFKANNFSLGISIDGPAHLHDANRPDNRGYPSHAQTMEGLERVKAHGIQYSVLCTVNSTNMHHPLEVYDFFRSHGVTSLQFIPIVNPAGNGTVTPESVDSLAYGQFLSAIFDKWFRNDLWKVWVQIFEECHLVLNGNRSNLCLFQETCGDSLVMEHNGDLYCCDHFVREDYKLGNIEEKSLKTLVESPKLKKFAQDKRDALPDYCMACGIRNMCNGGCPKDRIIHTPDGEPGLNYLCEGYRHFFNHVRPAFTRLIRDARRASAYQKRIDERNPARKFTHQAGTIKTPSPSRNAPCPCGSGRKYKACCMSQ